MASSKKVTGSKLLRTGEIFVASPGAPNALDFKYWSASSGSSTVERTWKGQLHTQGGYGWLLRIPYYIIILGIL